MDNSAKLEDLKRSYIESLKTMSDEITEQWAILSLNPTRGEYLPELLNSFHKLAGNAANFGFDELGNLAREVNDEFRRFLDDPALLSENKVELVSIKIKRLIDLASGKPLPPPSKIGRSLHAAVAIAGQVITDSSQPR